MSDRPTPITDAAKKHCAHKLPLDLWADYMAGACVNLERQLAEAREQRDRLADAITAWNESLDLCECDYGCDGRMPLQGEKCAKCLLWGEVLAAIAAVVKRRHRRLPHSNLNTSKQLNQHATH